jgi:SdrD B-like domain
MSQEDRQNHVQEQNHSLLQGPLKHIRAAALAAALVPLASVAATPAQAQAPGCFSGGFCGFVWNDANNNGIQDDGDSKIVGAVVSVVVDGITYTVPTDENGFYDFGFIEPPPGEYQISVQIPPGTMPSPANAGSDDTLDSDGVSDELGNSVATLDYTGTPDANTDFGFHLAPTQAPGTGTPGYWKNHPEAWPVNSIVIGGHTYSKAEALSFLDTPGKDKRLTMFSSLLSAMLNVLVGNDASCVSKTISDPDELDANEWMATYAPDGVGVGPAVHASSFAWKIGEPLHRQMDNYNNGMLCAAHRD